jgi:hypothetical protein
LVIDNVFLEPEIPQFDATLALLDTDVLPP